MAADVVDVDVRFAPDDSGGLRERAGDFLVRFLSALSGAVRFGAYRHVHHGPVARENDAASVEYPPAHADRLDAAERLRLHLAAVFRRPVDLLGFKTEGENEKTDGEDERQQGEGDQSAQGKLTFHQEPPFRRASGEKTRRARTPSLRPGTPPAS